MARHARAPGRVRYGLRLVSGSVLAGAILVGAIVALRAVPNQPAPATVPPGGAVSAPSSSPAGPTPPAAPASVPPQRVTVTYEILGPGQATMVYTDGSSQLVDEPAARLPWRHSENVGPGWMAGAVSGTSEDPDARLYCRIYIDDEPVAAMTGRGRISCKMGD